MRRSVIRVAALVAALMLPACASTHARHLVTVSVVSADATLSAVQDVEAAAVCGQPTAVPAACVSAAQHQQIAAQLHQAFMTDAQLAQAVRSWDPSTPEPSTIAGWLAEISAVVNDVIAALPDGRVKTKLLATIGGQ